MIVPLPKRLSFADCVGRWAGVGPYYAMFPVDFAFGVVREYSSQGDGVLDPFAGRATSVYAAAAQGRYGLGIEIHPVGWLYGHTKIGPASLTAVLRRLDTLGRDAISIPNAEIDLMPAFFRACYTSRVFKFLLAARSSLRWRESTVDGTIMALILVYLHGKREASLSNQTRQGKAMSPDYSVRWWAQRGMNPPDVSPVEFMKQRVLWRYAKGRPQFTRSRVLLGDARKCTRRIGGEVQNGKRSPFRLLFTSPPYHSVTNYHYDQWLRLWMLGGPPQPVYSYGDSCNRFESQIAYRDLLQQTFDESARALAADSTVYVRTDARSFTRETTIEVLRNAFPGKSMEVVERPFHRQTQTALFGDSSTKPGEVDLILRG